MDWIGLVVPFQVRIILASTVLTGQDPCVAVTAGNLKLDGKILLPLELRPVQNRAFAFSWTFREMKIYGDPKFDYLCDYWEDQDLYAVL